MYCSYFQSPIGEIKIQATEKEISSIEFVESLDLHDQSISNEITEQAVYQLEEYFNGQRQSFDLPLSDVGTDFQGSVWQQLKNISYGTTLAYKDIAKKIGKPKAMRAVGSANAKNPLAVVVPCHRVISSNGKLSGYAYGEDKKAWLINFENKNLSN